MTSAQSTTTAQGESSLELQAASNRLARLIVLVVLLLTAGVFLLIPYLAYRWAQLPFPGAFVAPTLIFHGMGSGDWALLKAGAGFPDRLVAIDGGRVASLAELRAALARRAPGDTVDVVFEKASGPWWGPYRAEGEVAVRLQLARFALGDLLNYFVVPYFVGLAFLVIGLWVFWLRRDDLGGRAFALFCASGALAVGALFDVYTASALATLWAMAVPLVGATLFTLAAVFPQESKWVAQRPWLRWLGYPPGLAIFAATITPLNELARPEVYAAGWTAGWIYAALGAAFFLATGAYRWWRAGSPIAREQGRLVVLAGAISVGPLLTWIASTIVVDSSLKFQTPYLMPLVVFPVGVAYAILRYRLLNSEYFLSRALVYFLLGSLAAVGYLLLVAGLGVILGAAMPANSPVLIALMVLILFVGLHPLRAWLQKRIDYYFFRGSRIYDERLQEFSRAMAEAVDLPTIVAQLRDQIERILKPSHLHAYLHDASRAEYAAYSQGGRPQTDIRFGAESPLARALASQPTTVYLAPDSPLPSHLQRDRARLAVLGSAVFVPLANKNGLVGWLALGHRLAGEPYSRQDLAFCQSLADYAALAVERARAVGALEKRVGELSVLSQMSQAINFSISFDDLLELIYAQTGRVLDVRNFAIVLHEPRAHTLRFAFLVENDERITERENKPWPYGAGLVTEVIRTGHSLLTDSYLVECARRRVEPLQRSYHAWLGVPLNTGTGTLGAMTIAATEPGRVYTDDQLKTFAAIADQAATAIDKARLYQQTERRARQLETLNQVAQTITSTFELEPLLQVIVDSATDILGCEAGSLFLIDEETNDSVFKVAVGPVASDLIGLRVPAGRGIVGSAAESGEAVVVNDTASDPRWFQKPDEATGFVSRALMAVPLRIKERTIGVLEVINKRDGSAFDEEDTTLLTAFAGQAAVSIENARLFSSTDQALAARVDELSVMQRIDRQLNAALDVKKVMGIVLDRALDNTGADAALAGIVVDDGLLVVAHRGYGDAAAPHLAAPFSTDEGLIGRALAAGRPLLETGEPGEPEPLKLVPGTASRLAIPIFREADTIGLVILDSREAGRFTDDHIAYVTRLGDHAAIAIANARLYSEVNAANLAKSEFVSLVSHELKTPMTSIKGYADWLATGAVGPLNATQQEFVHTIRGNIERMMTIVSDLADIARIESGRMRLETKALPFQNVIDDVVRTMQGQYDAKQQTLVLDVEPALPPVWGDHVRLVQVLTNLMSNSHKYSPPGATIALRVQRSANVSDPGGAAEVLHVSVRDSGYGISPADQKKIFSKFFRAEDRAVREAPGTGLGLNIVKLLVELGGGRAWFESQLGQGSTFHFTVPLAESVGPSENEGESEPEAAR